VTGSVFSANRSSHRMPRRRRFMFSSRGDAGACLRRLSRPRHNCGGKPAPQHRRRHRTSDHASGGPQPDSAGQPSEYQNAFPLFSQRHLLTIFWFFLGVTHHFLLDFINTSGARNNIPASPSRRLHPDDNAGAAHLQQTVPFVMCLRYHDSGLAEPAAGNGRHPRGGHIGLQFMMPFVIGAIITGLWGSSCSILSPRRPARPRCRSISNSQPPTAHPRNQPIPGFGQIVDNDDVIIAPRRCPMADVTQRCGLHPFGPQSDRFETGCSHGKIKRWLLLLTRYGNPARSNPVVERGGSPYQFETGVRQERRTEPETLIFSTFGQDQGPRTRSVSHQCARDTSSTH